MPKPRTSIKRPAVGAFAALLAFVLIASTAATLAEDQLATAESTATTDADTPEGETLGESLGAAFGREHSSTIQRCAKAAKRPDLSDFELYLRVDGAGTVDQSLVTPATALASCVRDKMLGWKVPAPPHAGFWAKVSVNLKSK